MTKDELAAKVAQQEVLIGDHSTADQCRRKEFAKAFGWYKSVTSYQGYGHKEPGEPRLPSWEEIFVELGKLLAARNFMDFEGNLSEVECKLEDLERKIKSEIHPNL